MFSRHKSNAKLPSVSMHHKRLQRVCLLHFIRFPNWHRTQLSRYCLPTSIILAVTPRRAWHRECIITNTQLYTIYISMQICSNIQGTIVLSFLVMTRSSRIPNSYRTPQSTTTAFILGVTPTMFPQTHTIVHNIFANIAELRTRITFNYQFLNLMNSHCFGWLDGYFLIVCSRPNSYIFIIRLSTDPAVTLQLILYIFKINERPLYHLAFI